MSTYKGKFSPDDLSGTLGDKQDWHGAGLRRRTGIPKDMNATRRNFSDGAVGDVWDVSSPGTPNSETDAPIPQIKDRGGMGFSGKIDFGILGRPQRPGKP